MAKVAIPLETLTVASPCSVPWKAMPGDDRVRSCRECRQYVYNLSEMDRAEAESLIQRTEGRLCVRFDRRSDGTVMTRDCLAGVQAARRRLAWIVGLAAAGLILTAGCVTMLFASRSSETGSRRVRDIEPIRSILEWLDPTPPMVMGDICVPTPTPPNSTPPPGPAPDGPAPQPD